MMNPNTHHRARRLVPAAMAAVLALSVPVHGDDDAQVKQLQAENAALRQRLAQLEQANGSATAPATGTTPAPSSTEGTTPVAAGGTTGPVTPTTTSAMSASDQPPKAPGSDVTVMSPFEVATDKDYGYLKTNSVTATRIGMPIQQAPMYVQVLSSDFIQDLDLSNNVVDLLRYTAAAAGDNHFASAVPSNSATSQGTFTIRGFPVNNLLRDGVFNYNYYNMDNLDRVEIVQGPAAIFFGQGYPGGVINFLTKQPEFHHVPTTITYTYGQDGENHLVLDTNQQLSDRVAIRVVSGYENSGGQRSWEFTKDYNVEPNLTIIPFGNEKLKITVGDQEDQTSYNENNSAWYYPNSWFQAYANPSPALIAAGGTGSAAGEQARIFNSLGNFDADQRAVSGNPEQPLYTSVSPWGYETELNGQRQQLKNFDFNSRGAYEKKDDNIATLKVESSPFSWLDLRYVYTKTAEFYDAVNATTVPNADGQTFNTISGISTPGYHNFIRNHQVDAVVKTDFWGIKNKLLGGFVYQPWLQQYNSAFPVLNYSTTPGATNPIANPNNAYVPVYQQSTAVPSSQVLYNRSGGILQVNNVYAQWDPAVNPAPDVAVLYPNYSPVMDGYAEQENDWYINDQMALFNDRLNLLGGFRQETHRDAGQDLTANFPYFSPPPYAYTNQTAYPPGVYNYSAAYEASNFDKETGNSYMAGASFDITKEITVYATTSKTFKLNTGTISTQNVALATPMLQAALSNVPSFVYHGQTITTVAQGLAALQAAGAFNPVVNETGLNYEAGVKTSLLDNKIVTTFAIFRGIRENQKLDDVQAQNTDPLNYSTTIFAPGSPYYNTRNLRWYSSGQQNLVYGGEMQATLTPIRNFQSVINFGYLPTARVVSDPRYSLYYAQQSAVNAAFYKMYYSSRMANVPQYTFNIVNKYTFDTGYLRGFSILLAAREESERVYSQSFDWNPQEGGWQMPQYVVFDGGLGYTYELMGYRLKTNLSMQNLGNTTYYEGGPYPGQHFSWQLTNSVSF